MDKTLFFVKGIASVCLLHDGMKLLGMGVMPRAPDMTPKQVPPSVMICNSQNSSSFVLSRLVKCNMAKADSCNFEEAHFQSPAILEQISSKQLCIDMILLAM